MIFGLTCLEITHFLILKIIIYVLVFNIIAIILQ